ncbi:hypothetical protein [Mucilaginibacter pocheonensis]|uniref:Uncharacterized protein n=1 Tax=Mucilaginibacter pocheonensis TaxID=398050 RepID=A0ABU1TFV2_9SPHI|nr:hypothetical protein [Mucilaginibacter pocheonensis]MDR6944304.1 hypothetical protein [Mucilaginibacter pocheonensis]
MDKHYGQIVEYRVRKNGYCISDLGRCMNVNRRSIYNWFNQKQLKRDVIFRIGCIIRHDFTQEFPELFESDDFKVIYQVPELPLRYGSNFDYTEQECWKNKYLLLLEKYNEMLLQKTDETSVSDYTAFASTLESPK